MSKGLTIIDRFIGKRIGERRKLVGLSRTSLAAAIGTSPHQVYKYEMGRNVVSASRLLEIAHALETSPNAFFEGLEEPTVPVPALVDLMRSLGRIQNPEDLAVINHVVRVLNAKHHRDRRIGQTVDKDQGSAPDRH